MCKCMFAGHLTTMWQVSLLPLKVSVISIITKQLNNILFCHLAPASSWCSALSGISTSASSISCHIRHPYFPQALCLWHQQRQVPLYIVCQKITSGKLLVVAWDQPKAQSCATVRLLWGMFIRRSLICMCKCASVWDLCMRKETKPFFRTVGLLCTGVDLLVRSWHATTLILILFIPVWRH